MTKKEQLYLILTGLLGPIGLFFVSKAGGVTVSLLAVILAQLFYNDLGYIPITWAIIIIILSLAWAVSAMKNKNSNLYFPYAIDIYKVEDKDYKYLVNTFFGMIQFALVLAIVVFIYIITVNNG